MALAHVGRSPGAASLVDVLCGVTDKGFVGVSELVPGVVRDSYIADLERRENRLFLDDGFPLHTFGAVASRDTVWKRLGSKVIGRILGTKQHVSPRARVLVATEAGQGLSKRADIWPFALRVLLKLPQDAAMPPHFGVAVTSLQLPAAVPAARRRNRVRFSAVRARRRESPDLAARHRYEPVFERASIQTRRRRPRSSSRMALSKRRAIIGSQYRGSEARQRCYTRVIASEVVCSRGLRQRRRS